MPLITIFHTVYVIGLVDSSYTDDYLIKRGEHGPFRHTLFIERMGQ